MSTVGGLAATQLQDPKVEQDYTAALMEQPWEPIQSPPISENVWERKERWVEREEEEQKVSREMSVLYTDKDMKVR